MPAKKLTKQQLAAITLRARYGDNYWKDVRAKRKDYSTATFSDKTRASAAGYKSANQNLAMMTPEQKTKWAKRVSAGKKYTANAILIDMDECPQCFLDTHILGLMRIDHREDVRYDKTNNAIAFMYMLNDGKMAGAQIIPDTKLTNATTVTYAKEFKERYKYFLTLIN